MKKLAKDVIENYTTDLTIKGKVENLGEDDLYEMLSEVVKIVISKDEGIKQKLNLTRFIVDLPSVIAYSLIKRIMEDEHPIAQEVFEELIQQREIVQFLEDTDQEFMEIEDSFRKID